MFRKFSFFLFLSLVTTLSAMVIPVKTGWNLIGTKFKIDDFLQLLQKVDIIYAYNKGDWKVASLKYQNLKFTKLSNLKEGEGFWIYSNKNQELLFDDKNIIDKNFIYKNGWQILSPKKQSLTSSD
jgi:hypothetical protein